MKADVGAPRRSTTYMSTHDEQIAPLETAAVEFGRLTMGTVETRADSQIVHITPREQATLNAHITAIQRQIDGVEELNDDEVLRQHCVDANIPYEDLARFDEPSDTDDQRRAHRNVELGDLGELLGALSLVAHLGISPRAIHPKNLLKTNHKISVTGIDLLIIELADGDHAHELLPGDRVSLVESKASESDGPTLLLGLAAESAETVSIMRLKNELRVLKRILRLRGYSTAQIERTRLFNAELIKQRHSIPSKLRQIAILATDTDKSVQFARKCDESTFDTVILIDVNITELTDLAYQHRRIA